MPTLEHAGQLREFVEEVFQLSTDVWAAQSKGKQSHEAEISETEFLTLDLLAKSAPLTVGEIQRRIGVLPAQMSRVIRSLENKGDQPLVSCSINPQDKRKIDVVLTPAGRKAHQAYRERKLGSIQKMLAGLSENDRNELMRILRLIRDMMRKDMQNK